MISSEHHLQRDTARLVLPLDALPLEEPLPIRSQGADAALDAVGSDEQGVVPEQVWLELALGQKQRLQQVLFPESLRFDGEKFGTAVTCLAFKQLPDNDKVESSVASPPGFEPGFQP
jgi:hypothetical protein